MVHSRTEEAHLEEPADGKPVAKWITLGTTCVILASLGIWAIRASGHRATALDSGPKGVGVIPAAAADYRPEYRFVGTLMPWSASRVGPQYISAYLTDVLVRPGGKVRRGDILARLQPQRAQALNDASRLQAQAIESKLAAVQQESLRIQGLMKKGIVSVNEAENKLAEAKSEEAKLGAARAQLETTRQEVQDSTLRAPFDGEIAERLLDPGAFVHPGDAIVTVVDRSKIRISADAPEEAFADVSPGTPVKISLLADGRTFEGAIARRSPAADAATRTVHFEIDLENKDRSIPVGTTAELRILSKTAHPSVTVPARAAVIRGDKATIWSVEQGVARRQVVRLLGAVEGRMYLDASLPAGTSIVSEGGSQLREGDRVEVHPGPAPQN